MTKILICGDYCSRGRVATLINEGHGNVVFQQVEQYVRESDFALVNLECPVTEDFSTPITKLGPSLACNEKAVEVLQKIGVYAVTLANNHILDYSGKALLNTLDVCKKNKIQTVGAGRDMNEAGQILYLIQSDKTIAIINCCEHEYSIATENTAGANPLDPIRQYSAIQEARQNADYVIVIVHGGTEHYQLPSPRMQDIYRFFVEVGADAVINHHQHCYSGYEIYKEKPIFYGIGNFCFDYESKRDSIWNEGYMIELKLDDAIGFSIFPYIQCNDDPVIRFLTEIENKRFHKRIEELNKIIAEPSMLRKAYRKRCKSSEEQMKVILSPYIGRITMGLAKRKLLPLFMSKQRIVRLFNFIECESHREKLVEMLKHAIKDE